MFKMHRALLLFAVLGAVAPVVAQSAIAKSALVIVVEENQRGKGDLQAHLQDLATSDSGTIRNKAYKLFMDRVGEPLYGRYLKSSALRYWDHAVLLTDDKASFKSFVHTLEQLDRQGYTIDVLMDIHGSSTFTELDNHTRKSGPDKLGFTGPSATPAQVAALREKDLRLNAVYMTSCWGSRFNDAWLQAGARAVNGSRELNYYVLLSPIVFIHAFGRGGDLAAASRKAYEAEANLLNNDVVDQALAPTYGRPGVARIQSALSSERIHSGQSVRAACYESITTSPGHSEHTGKAEHDPGLTLF